MSLGPCGLHSQAVTMNTGAQETHLLGLFFGSLLTLVVLT